jgi:hypothetical protein
MPDALVSIRTIRREACPSAVAPNEDNGSEGYRSERYRFEARIEACRISPKPGKATNE